MPAPVVQHQTMHQLCLRLGPVLHLHHLHHVQIDGGALRLDGQHSVNNNVGEALGLSGVHLCSKGGPENILC